MRLIPAARTALIHCVKNAVLPCQPNEGSHPPWTYKSPYNTPFSMDPVYSNMVGKRKPGPMVSRQAAVVSNFITLAGGTTLSERYSSITSPVVMFCTSTDIFACPVIGCVVRKLMDNNILTKNVNSLL